MARGAPFSFCPKLQSDFCVALLHHVFIYNFGILFIMNTFALN